jgi:GrpB-like predicted nucleotidyltransferase (UPF0157 family)
MRISVVAYDPDWPRRFADERVVLERLLAPWLCGGVHHIGSTSIPGLAAKPIVDMMAGVLRLPEAQPAIALLSQYNYVHAPHRPNAYWFYKPPTPNWYEHAYHLHLTEPGSDVWRERLAFRDALRADPALRDEYQALKLRLAQAHGADVTAYTSDKREFVARVLAGVGVALASRRRSAR